MIAMASNGHLEGMVQQNVKVAWHGTHFFTQIPHPMQRNSEMKAILSEGFTSIQSFPAQQL